MKKDFYLVTIFERNGEFEYGNKFLVESSDKTIEEDLRKICADYRGDAEDGHWDEAIFTNLSGTVQWIHNWTKIPGSDARVLKKYLSVL